MQTEDGYYAIVVEENAVLLSNGMEEQMDNMKNLKVLPLNIFQEGGVANFRELLVGMTECRFPPNDGREYSKEIFGGK